MNGSAHSAALPRRLLPAACALLVACAAANAAAKAPAKKPAWKPKPAPVVRTADGLSVSSKYRSPRNTQRRPRKTTRFIVLHTTEGAKTDLDGCSIGIEIVGRHDKEITAAQYATLRKLLSELKRTYEIPDRNVLTHSMVAYGNANHWHKYRHRGRKRCGMLLASPSARAKLGLQPGPSFDPDVKAGRLRNADPELARILYAKSAAVAAAPAPKGGVPAKTSAPAAPAPTPPTAPPRVQAVAKPAPESNVIGPGRSAWDIARDRYDDASTVYTFPNGRRKTGAEITSKEWRTMPAGTVVEVDAAGSAPENGNEGLLTIGVDGTADGLAGDAIASQSTFYFPEGKPYRTGATMSLSEIESLPSGTRMLVGYKAVGPVSPKRPVFSLCGVAWNRGDTYYWDPARRTLRPGDEITERTIPKDAMVFVRKD